VRRGAEKKKEFDTMNRMNRMKKTVRERENPPTLFLCVSHPVHRVQSFSAVMLLAT
jgi:hypothetical protein